MIEPGRLEASHTHLQKVLHAWQNIGHHEHSDALPPLPRTVHHLLCASMLLWFKKLQNSRRSTLLSFRLYATRQQKLPDAFIFGCPLGCLRGRWRGRLQPRVPQFLKSSCFSVCVCGCVHERVCTFVCARVSSPVLTIN